MNDRKRPAWAERSDLERNYYDTEWGMPVVSEKGSLRAHGLEVFQSPACHGQPFLSAGPTREAFSNFDVDTVAA